MQFILKKNAIYHKLKSNIISGKYPDMHKLPQEDLFARELNVGRITLRSALARLKEENFIVRIPSKGTFVRAPEKTKANQIIILHPDMNDLMHHYQLDILSGIKHSAKQFNLHLKLCRSEILNESALKHISKDEVLGIIPFLTTFRGDEPILKLLRKSGLPVVLPSNTTQDYQITGFPTVVAPKKESWQSAIEHLIDRGHRRIGTITPKRTTIRGYKIDEYRSLLKSIGAAASIDLIKETKGFSYDEIDKSVLALMNLEIPPTAIICYSEPFALYVLKSLKHNNYKVPEQVAVMGFDGSDESSFYDPPLSIIKRNYFKSGEMSVEILRKNKEWFNKTNASPPLLYNTSYKLLVRQSTNINRIEYKLSK